ncbi:hypothetical protein SAMN05192534_1198 [Alteribacillus persepolensis]|uniref:Uncharacterized protein n=1 Tax=Alteribacillus persepolensis TaxID=568899 RepID=A0A1G8H943_9BACI|nr:hypothetical protein [Alteribacillus persepolensis]SDI03162.1 hypothetical protein SAMN05192534_1198 [Alteribacillus persepolensis]
MLNDTLELQALEVHLLLFKMKTHTWYKIYYKMKQYIETLQEDQIAAYPEKADIEKRVYHGHIHIHIKRSFTTDAVLLYEKLNSYVNKNNPVILIGVTNQHGKVSSPLIVDLIVMLHKEVPDYIVIKGSVHPHDWLAAEDRLRHRGFLPQCR